MGITEAGQERGALFLRKSSGLVKSATGLDAFIFNISVMSLGMGVLAVHLVVPAFNPGANIPLSWLLSTVVLFPIAVAYYYWSITLPRTGGNYIYLTRSMPLGIALVFNFIELYAFLFFAAFAASFVAPVVAGSLWHLGASTDNTALISASETLASQNWIFVVGVLAMVLAVALQLRGTEMFFRIQRVLFTLAAIGTLLGIGALLFVSSDSFGSNLSSLTGTSLGEIESTAAEGGFVTAEFSFVETLKAIVWPVLTMWAFFFSISFGGEIKEAKRSQLVGIVGSCLAFGAGAFVLSLILNSRVSIGEQGALLWNYYLETGPTLPTSPNFSTFVFVAVNNPVVTVAVGISFILWVFFWVTNIPMYCARTLFAHSMDRVAPSAVGHVTPRRRVPLGSIVAAYGLTFLFYIMFVYADWFATLAIGMPLFFAWIASLTSGALLPWTRPSLWNQSPAAAYRIGSLYWMTVVCFIGVAVLLMVEYFVYRDPSSFATTLSSWVAVGATVALAIVAYLGAFLWRRRQGVDLERLTSEIPVE